MRTRPESRIRLFLNVLIFSERMPMNRAPQGQPREERRRASQFFDGAERRRTYAEGEMPPDPTPGELRLPARIADTFRSSAALPILPNLSSEEGVACGKCLVAKVQFVEAVAL